MTDPEVNLGDLQSIVDQLQPGLDIWAKWLGFKDYADFEKQHPVEEIEETEDA